MFYFVTVEATKEYSNGVDDAKYGGQRKAIFSKKKKFIMVDQIRKISLSFPLRSERRELCGFIERGQLRWILSPVIL
jgi:hypothetical protein